MASLKEAIDIKRKTYFEFEGAPYVCVDVEVSKPTARGGQTLVRLKMRNLLTRAVFDKTFKAGEKFAEPDLSTSEASFLYSDSAGYHFMDQESLRDADAEHRRGRRRSRVPDGQHGRAAQQARGPAVRPAAADDRRAHDRVDRAGGPRRHRQRRRTKAATLETGLEIRVPLFIKEGERVKVHTETREFAGRA